MEVDELTTYGFWVVDCTPYPPRMGRPNISWAGDPIWNLPIPSCQPEFELNHPKPIVDVDHYPKTISRGTLDIIPFTRNKKSIPTRKPHVSKEKMENLLKAQRENFVVLNDQNPIC